MKYNKDIHGIGEDTNINIEVRDGGIIEVFTDSPRVCCVSIVKLDINMLDNLILALVEAREIINQGNSK